MPPKQPVQQQVQSSGLFIYPNGDTYNGEYTVEIETTFRNGQGTYTCFGEETLKMPEVPQQLKD